MTQLRERDFMSQLWGFVLNNQSLGRNQRLKGSDTQGRVYFRVLLLKASMHLWHKVIKFEWPSRLTSVLLSLGVDSKLVHLSEKSLFGCWLHQLLLLLSLRRSQTMLDETKLQPFNDFQLVENFSSSPPPSLYRDGEAGGFYAEVTLKWNKISTLS